MNDYIMQKVLDINDLKDAETIRFIEVKEYFSRRSEHGGVRGKLISCGQVFPFSVITSDGENGVCIEMTVRLTSGGLLRSRPQLQSYLHLVNAEIAYDCRLHMTEDGSVYLIALLPCSGDTPTSEQLETALCNMAVLAYDYRQVVKPLAKNDCVPDRRTDASFYYHYALCSPIKKIVYRPDKTPLTDTQIDKARYLAYDTDRAYIRQNRYLKSYADDRRHSLSDYIERLLKGLQTEGE